mgnify:CR=1 FL=1
MHKLISLILAVFFLVSCVSNQTVRTVELRDYDLNCDQLKYELTEVLFSAILL